MLNDNSYIQCKLKHLELIQNIISRLSNNSSLIKGWSVMLVSALFALSANNSNIAFVYLAYFPTAIFWGLDGYYLSQERKFRELYKMTSETNPEDINFSMDASLFKDDKLSWPSAVISMTLVPFHGILIAAIAAVMITLQ